MKITDFLHVKPILSTASDGSMKPVGIIFGTKKRPKNTSNAPRSYGPTRGALGFGVCIWPYWFGISMLPNVGSFEKKITEILQPHQQLVLF